MPTASANGIRIEYVRSGAGPRLLFIGGSGQTLASSRPMVEPFTRSFDVVVYDQRGLGDSSKPPGPYSMADYAADAAGLLDGLEWASARVAGVSFGGMVAQELAVTWPERVERLALLCTSPGGDGGSSYPLHDLELLAPDERARRAVELLDTRFTPEYLASHPADEALAGYILERESSTPDEEQRRGMSEQLAARSHHDVFDRLPRISCPTLVACGRYDGIAPPANGAAIAAQIPGSELREYEGGHAFFAQDPDAFTDVMSFLAGDADA